MGNKIFFLFFFLLSLWGKDDLTILHTTDIHGYLYEESGSQANGLLRLGTAVEKIKELDPDYLWIDTGDNCAGGFEAWLSKGEITYRSLDFLGCHFFVPGNHEMDYGPLPFYQILKRYSNKFICCNLQIYDKKNKENVSFKPYVILQHKGKKIAIIGATRDYISNIQNTINQDHLTITTSYVLKELPRLIKEIKQQKVDLLILAIHQGRNLRPTPNHPDLVNLIAQNFPEIDLILGGHTHIADPGSLLHPYTWFVQSPCHGEGIGVIKVTFQKKDRPLISSSLLFAKDYSPSSQLLQFLESDLTIAKNKAQKVVFSLKETLNGDGVLARSCVFSEISHQAFIHATQAVASFQSKFDAPKLKKGPNTFLEFYNFIPYDNKVFLADVTLEDLKTIIKECEDHSMLSCYSALHGIYWSFDPKTKKVSLQIPHQLKQKERITIAISSYFAAGAGYRLKKTVKILSQPSCHLRNTNYDARLLILDWLQQHPQLCKPYPWRQSP